MTELPFDASRRLTGANLFFATTGAQLETVGLEVDAALLAAWQERISRARAHLGWPQAELSVRRHAGGVSLALAAPCDQLYTATEVNEWALCAALSAREPGRWPGLEQALGAAALEEAGAGATVIPPVLAADAALARFSQLAQSAAPPPAAATSSWRHCPRLRSCRGMPCTTCPPRSSPARTARPPPCGCSRPAPPHTAGRRPTAAPTVCSSARRRWRAATTPARSGRGW